jgi:hypothetical protein
MQKAFKVKVRAEAPNEIRDKPRQGVAANPPMLDRHGAVGFID